MAPRLQLVWKRGPLAPVVVVGEGQVNLVATGCSRLRAMVKVSKALWLMIIKWISIVSGCDSSCCTGCRRLRKLPWVLQDLQEVSVVLLTSVAAGYGAGLSSWCLITRKKLVWRLLDIHR